MGIIIVIGIITIFTAMVLLFFLIMFFKNFIRKEIFRINSLNDYGNLSERDIIDISFEEVLVCKGFSNKNEYRFVVINDSKFFTIKNLFTYIHEEELFFGYRYKIEKDTYKLIRVPNLQFLEHKIAMDF